MILDSIIVAIVVVAVGLVEERMVYLGQQHSRNKAVVVFTVVVKDSTI